MPASLNRSASLRNNSNSPSDTRCAGTAAGDHPLRNLEVLSNFKKRFSLTLNA